MVPLGLGEGHLEQPVLLPTPGDLEVVGRCAHIAQLELELTEAEVAPLPTEDDRQQLHRLLVDRIQTGPVPVRKALFTALVERLEVHDLDDIRPTFRLGGPELPGFVNAEEPADPEPRPASEGLVFASHSSGWS